jgi:hypothetical protein
LDLDNTNLHVDDEDKAEKGEGNHSTEQSLKRHVQSLEELLDRQLNKDRAQAAERIQQQKREYEHRLRTLQCSMMRTQRNMEQTTDRLREIEKATTLFQKRAEFLEVRFEQEIKTLQGQVDFFNAIAKENRDLKNKLLQREDELQNLRAGVAGVTNDNPHESILNFVATTIGKESFTRCEETKGENAPHSDLKHGALLRYSSLLRGSSGDDESNHTESICEPQSLRGLTSGSTKASTDSVQDLLGALRRAQEASARAQGLLRNRDKTTVRHDSYCNSKWNDQVRTISSTTSSRSSSSSLEIENDMESFHTWQSRLSNHRNRRRTNFMEEEIAELESRVQDMLQKIGRS